MRTFHAHYSANSPSEINQVYKVTQNSSAKKLVLNWRKKAIVWMCLWHICPLTQDDTENQTDWYQEIQWTSFASDANLQPYKIRVTRLFGLIDIEFCEVYCKLISMSPNWLVIRIYSGQTNWCKQRYSQLRLHQMQTDSLKKFELHYYWLNRRRIMRSLL